MKTRIKYKIWCQYDWLRTLLTPPECWRCEKSWGQWWRLGVLTVTGPPSPPRYPHYDIYNLYTWYLHIIQYLQYLHRWACSGTLASPRTRVCSWRRDTSTCEWSSPVLCPDLDNTLHGSIVDQWSRYSREQCSGCRVTGGWTCAAWTPATSPTSRTPWRRWWGGPRLEIPLVSLGQGSRAECW